MLTNRQRHETIGLSRISVVESIHSSISPRGKALILDKSSFQLRGFFCAKLAVQDTDSAMPLRTIAVLGKKAKNDLLDLCPRIKQDYRRINSAVRLYCTPKGNMQSGLPPIQGVLIESKTFSPADYILQAGFTEIELTTYCE